MADRSLKPQWFQILLSLADHDRHGYSVMQDVLERTEGRMRLWPGMLYRSLRSLCDQGLIREVAPPARAPDDDMTRRYYRLTPSGRRVLAEETRRLAAYVQAARAKKVLRPAE
jgi:DNA-binding PadR family transcriptional regulator